MITPLQKQLLNNYQQDFPLSAQPYLDIAQQLGVTETEVLNAFQELFNQGFISRIGTVIKPNKIGASCLAAMTVPTPQLHETAAIINQFSEVNHNYEREHTYNLWFVVIAQTPTHLQSVMHEINIKTGFSALQLPLLKEYVINLGFPLAFTECE